ncbi:efflux RND transporter periplasmic adaptor subunit [Draconibacterium sp.]
MNSKLSHTIFIAALTLMVFSCNNAKNTKPDGQTNAETEKVYPVGTQLIEKQKIVRTLEYTANLIPFTEIHLAPASPGRISKINVQVGNRVSKGQVLVEMDKTQLAQAKTQLENARYNFMQIDTLYRLGSIAEQQYENVKTQYELAKSNVDFLSENTTLKSPIDGIVTGKYFENGEMYSGAPNTPAGKAAVLSLMQINPLKAVVNISQTYFPDVKQGMKTRVTTDIYPDKQFDGKVYRVYPTISSSTRTFLTEVEVKNSNESLRPGMFTNISIELHSEEILVVPAISVLKQEGTNNRHIFVNENGKARKIQVELGKRIDDKMEIIANGVREGSEIIVTGQANLLDGSSVKITNQ